VRQAEPVSRWLAVRYETGAMDEYNDTNSNSGALLLITETGRCVVWQREGWGGRATRRPSGGYASRSFSTWANVAGRGVHGLHPHLQHRKTASTGWTLGYIAARGTEVH
jgi:hypothetical protein